MARGVVSPATSINAVRVRCNFCSSPAWVGVTSQLHLVVSSELIACSSGVVAWITKPGSPVSRACIRSAVGISSTPCFSPASESCCFNSSAEDEVERSSSMVSVFPTSISSGVLNAMLLRTSPLSFSATLSSGEDSSSGLAASFCWSAFCLSFSLALSFFNSSFGGGGGAALGGGGGAALGGGGGGGGGGGLSASCIWVTFRRGGLLGSPGPGTGTPWMVTLLPTYCSRFPKPLI